MATAPMISPPRAPGGRSGLGTALHGIGARMARKREQEKKERELFEKLTRRGDVDRAAQAALDGLPPEANDIDRFAAVQEATEGVVAGYADQDGAQARDAADWARKTWLEPYRTKAHTEQDEQNEEALKSQFASIQRDTQLKMDAALARAVNPDLPQEEQQAAANEYTALTEQMTQLAVLVDPKIAGNQLEEWSRQHPAAAMGVIEESYAGRGRLTDLQKDIRRGRFKQFRSKQTVDERKAFDQGLAERILAEANERMKRREAEENREQDRQKDLEQKMAVELSETTVPMATVVSRYRSKGATEKTIENATKTHKAIRDTVEDVETARRKPQMEVTNRRWMNTRFPASSMDIMNLHIENGNRRADGLIDKDLYSRNEAQIKYKGERIKAMGARNASILSDVRRVWALKVGLPQSPDQWNDQNNLLGSQFNAAADELEDVLMETGDVDRDAANALYELMAVSMVARNQLDFTKSNLFPGVRFDEQTEPEKVEAQKIAMARRRAAQLRRVIQREGFLENASVKEIYEFVASPAEGGIAPMRIQAQFPTDPNTYSRQDTILAVQGLGLDQLGEETLITAIEVHIDEAQRLKGMAGMVKTRGQLYKERDAEAKAAEAERKLLQEEAAAAAEAEVIPDDPVSRAIIEDERRPRRTQTFAVQQDTPGGMTPLAEEYTAYREDRLARLEARIRQFKARQRMTPEQRALADRHPPAERPKAPRKRRR